MRVRVWDSGDFYCRLCCHGVYEAPCAECHTHGGEVESYLCLTDRYVTEICAGMEKLQLHLLLHSQRKQASDQLHQDHATFQASAAK